uniref:Biogenesis of lysosome-related organelles complex 1 subunit 1 n=1 Tax=Trichuris muris TaxID=70415 RepID=A0A5S6Q2R4_TRIMR
MLPAMLKEHHAEQQRRKDKLDNMRASISEAVTSFTDAAVDELNAPVCTLYVNQKKLDSELKRLERNLNRFCKTSAQWMSLIGNVNNTLKEFGDIENWASTMEADSKAILACLEERVSRLASRQNLTEPSGL